MEDLSLHILDITENSIEAGSTRVDIRVRESAPRDLMVLEIVDNGRGMDGTILAGALSPYMTTKKNKRIGLGLPLLAQSAEAAGGRLTVRSGKGCGTRIRATFKRSHIDLVPLGDVAQTLTTLIAANPGIDFSYAHDSGGRAYFFSTREFRKRLGGVPLIAPHALSLIKKDIKGGIARTRRTLPWSRKSRKSSTGTRPIRVR